MNQEESNLCQSAHAGERGMTLIEIMVVVVIIAMVAGFVGVKVFGVLADAQAKQAKTQILSIGEALDLYKLKYRNYPPTAEGLVALTTSKSNAEPVMDKIPKDPWGNGYVYISPGVRNTGSYDLMSYGSDGVQGGGDDVGNWDDE